MGSDDLHIQSLRDGKLILSTLFGDSEESTIHFDPVFDWKMLYDRDFPLVGLNLGGEERMLKLFMQPVADQEERFLICFTE